MAKARFTKWFGSYYGVRCCVVRYPLDKEGRFGKPEYDGGTDDRGRPAKRRFTVAQAVARAKELNA